MQGVEVSSGCVSALLPSISPASVIPFFWRHISVPVLLPRSFPEHDIHLLDHRQYHIIPSLQFGGVSSPPAHPRTQVPTGDTRLMQYPLKGGKEKCLSLSGDTLCRISDLTNLQPSPWNYPPSKPQPHFISLWGLTYLGVWRQARNSLQRGRAGICRRPGVLLLSSYSDIRSSAGADWPPAPQRWAGKGREWGEEWGKGWKKKVIPCIGAAGGITQMMLRWEGHFWRKKKQQGLCFYIYTTLGKQSLKRGIWGKGTSEMKCRAVGTPQCVAAASNMAVAHCILQAQYTAATSAPPARQGFSLLPLKCEWLFWVCRELRNIQWYSEGEWEVSSVYHMRLCVLTLTHVLPRVLPSISIEGDLDQNTKIEQENLTRACLTSNHTQSLLSVIKNWYLSKDILQQAWGVWTSQSSLHRIRSL